MPQAYRVGIIRVGTRVGQGVGTIGVGIDVGSTGLSGVWWARKQYW